MPLRLHVYSGIAEAMSEYILSIEDAAYALRQLEGSRPDQYAEIVEKHGAPLVTEFEGSYLLSGLTPGGYPGICYRGDGTLIPAIVYGRCDDYFSDQLSVLAWKYQQSATIEDETDEGELAEYLETLSVWNGFNSMSDVLLMTVYSDSGDYLDIEVNTIPHCAF